ncbi:MAG TPA: cupin domain-containing protein [Alphaproteobacteria bacterium]|nr:cupin domain-containing protein [Alphaproteobacteria bacterium]
MTIRTVLIACSLILAPLSAHADPAQPLREAVKPIVRQPIPNIPGKSLISLEVDYPPGAKSVPHHHGKSAFIYAYVLSGAIRSQVNDGPAKVYKAGETWFEPPGAYHKVSENASDTEPARLLVVIVADTNEPALTTPDHQ